MAKTHPQMWMLDTADPLGSVAGILERADALYAGTLGLDGRPQLRPAHFLFLQEGALYFLTAKNRRFYAELCKTPRLQLLAACPEAGMRLQLSGKACFTEDEALLDRCVRELPRLTAELGGEREALIAFFLLDARAAVFTDSGELPLTELRLPDSAEAPVGLTIKKKTELRDRLSRILERREAEPPAAAEETAKLYDGALFLFAETAKALWPRMDIRPIERAAVFETWEERERYTKLAAKLMGNAVIDKPEDLTYWLNPETLAALR